MTFSVPKSLVPFCNKPIVEHQIAAAVGAGVRHVILAVGWKADDMKEAICDLKIRYGIEITCSVEDVPLGTAGPIRLAESILRTGCDDEPFFVFNSDVICEFPLLEMLEFHKSHGGEGTICVTKVDDPSKYGVIVSNEEGRIERFVEKPSVFISDRINAGLYVLNKSVIERIDRGVFRMIETDVFPRIAADGKLFAFGLSGYWADIGQPKDFIKGMKMHLASAAAKLSKNLNESEEQARCFEIKQSGTVMIGKQTVIGEGSVVGPNVVIGSDCKIGKGVRLSNCTIFDRTRIEDFAHVNESIIGWNNRVGKWAKIDNATVTGEDVVFIDEVYINGALILPHKTIKERVLEAGKILM